MRNKIQIAFDLGSYSIKSAVGRILPDGKIEILSIAEIQSDSIDCGDIIDKDLLLSHLEILIEKNEPQEALILLEEIISRNNIFYSSSSDYYSFI